MSELSFSATEARIRRLMEYLTSALVDDLGVVIEPGAEWSTDPYSDPPKLTYRAADIPVIGDKVLHMIAHDIATLKYTTRWRYKWGKKKPSEMLEQASVRLFHAIEGARVDRTFSESYPGAASLFEEMHGTGENGMWDERIESGFDELPARWKFILNADRMLWGLDPLGKPIDRQRAEDSYDLMVDAAFTSNSQECADALMEVVRGRLADAVAEDEELQRRVEEIMRQKQQKSQPQPTEEEKEDGEDEPDGGDEGSEGSDDEHEPADEDDGQEGEQDGTPGRREKAHGGDDSDAGGEPDEGEDEGDEDGDDEGIGSGSGPGDKDEENEDEWIREGDAGNTGEDEDEEPVGSGDGEDGEDEDESQQVRPANIVEEMVEENKYSSNKTIKELRDRQQEREAEAADIERRIENEYSSIAAGATRVYGSAKFDRILERMRENAVLYRLDREEVIRLAKQLEAHARNVLFENSLHKFGGRYSSGRKIIGRKLNRVVTDDYRVFAKRRSIGGRSYAFRLVIDQSLSMDIDFSPSASLGMGVHGIGRYHGPDRRTPQRLAYLSAIVLCEALWDLASIGVWGFTDFRDLLPTDAYDYKIRKFRGRYANEKRRRAMESQKIGKMMRDSSGDELNLSAREYVSDEDPKSVLGGLLPELAKSFHSTPTDEAIKSAAMSLQQSDADVRAIIVITDGVPNSPDRAIAEAMRARRQGIAVRGLLIRAGLKRMEEEYTRRKQPVPVKRHGMLAGKTEMQAADEIARTMFDRYSDVDEIGDIVRAAIWMLRGLIRVSAA